jgi:hypothetical protein
MIGVVGTKRRMMRIDEQATKTVTQLTEIDKLKIANASTRSIQTYR